MILKLSRNKFIVFEDFSLEEWKAASGAEHREHRGERPVCRVVLCTATFLQSEKVKVRK